MLVLYLKISGFSPYSHFLIITILILPNCLGKSRMCFSFQMKISFVKEILVEY